MRNYSPDGAEQKNVMSHWRFGAFTGIGFGVLFGFISLGAVSNWTMALGNGLIGGLLFGIFWPALFFRRMREAEQQAYLGQGKFAVSVPEGMTADLRMASSFKRSPLIAVGGSLFLARRHAVFVPHSINLPEDLKPITLSIDDSTRIELVAQQTTFLQHLLIPNPPPALRIITGSSSYDLLVAAPEKAAIVVREIIFAS